MSVVALVKRIINQMLRDKRALALMMIAPLLILTLLNFLLESDTGNPKLGTHNLEDSLIEQLQNQSITTVQYDKSRNIGDFMIEHHLNGVLQFDGDEFQLSLLNEEPSKAKALQMKIQQAVMAASNQKQAINLKEFIQGVQGGLPDDSIGFTEVGIPSIQSSYIYGSDNTTFFDQLSPILVGFFVFFFVFLISGIGLLRERTTGTLERLLATPIQRQNIVFGYLLGYGLFAIIQTVIVVIYATKVLDVMLVGSIWHVILINLTLALVALSLGILLSAFANSEFQMMQFIPIAIVPQIFFAGLLPVEGMANWLQVIAKGMPMYYGGEALVAVMYKGLGIEAIQSELLILLGYALLFILLNIVTLKKYRKI